LDELRRLLHATRIPAIYVTHDQGEAFALADRLALLHDGSLVQVDEPQTVYQQPATTWVAQFFGLTNLVPGVVAAVSPLRVDTALGTLVVSGGGAPPILGSRVVVLIRPAVDVCEGRVVNSIKGVVKDVLFQGEWFAVQVECNGVMLQFNLYEPPVVGERIQLDLSPDNLICLEDR
jgi:ABC-type Fe3+/spermidine/putrescine transport system ATPase subunit